MVNEEIIKKTVELIKEDLSKRFVPILWLLKGAVAGAGLVFLNGIGKKMYNQFKNPGNYGDRNLLYWGSCYTFATISALSLFLLIFKGNVWLIKLFLVSNLIGLLGLVYYYINNKKYEAEKMLQKKEKTDIKIEEKKEKEVPKLTSKGVNI